MAAGGGNQAGSAAPAPPRRPGGAGLRLSVGGRLVSPRSVPGTWGPVAEDLPLRPGHTCPSVCSAVTCCLGGLCWVLCTQPVHRLWSTTPFYFYLRKVRVKVARSCPTLHDPRHYTGMSLRFLEFSRPGYWGGLPLPPDPGDLPSPEIKPRSPTLQQTLFFFNYYFYLAELRLSCSMWDLVPWPGIEPGPPALGAQRLRPQTTREIPAGRFFTS